MLSGVAYRKVDHRGLSIVHRGEDRLLAVDTVVVCAGQVPVRDILTERGADRFKVQFIGGADQAAELDANRAVEQGVLLAARI